MRLSLILDYGIDINSKLWKSDGKRNTLLIFWSGQVSKTKRNLEKIR